MGDVTVDEFRITLPAGVGIGQIRGRQDRPVKNGRWYLARGATVGRRSLLAKVGWGDLSFEDIEAFARQLGPDEILIVLPEHPPGGQHLPFHTPDAVVEPGTWCWYDRPDDPPGPTIADLVDGAWYAIVDRVVCVVDQFSEANRLGMIWRERGYRYTQTGRTVSTGRLRLKAIGPELLHQRLEQLLGDPSLRAVDLPARRSPNAKIERG